MDFLQRLKNTILSPLKKPIKTGDSPLLVIIGSTAGGKTDLGISCALRYNGEIVSTDSRQVYKGLDQLTGKVTAEETKDVPHHMIDCVEPGEIYNVSLFTEQACAVIADIQKRGKLPILVGGTGFYLENILFDGITVDVKPNEEYRDALALKSLEELQALLKEADPVAYERIDTRNPRKIIRALEILEVEDTVPMPKKIPRFPYCMIGIQHSRQVLKKRIEERLKKRFDIMTKEAEKLLEAGVDKNWLDDLGLESRHITRMLTLDMPEEEAYQNLLRAIFAYAKRQDTWWKRYDTVHWFHSQEYKKLYTLLDATYLT